MDEGVEVYEGKYFSSLRNVICYNDFDLNQDDDTDMNAGVSIFL